VQLKKIHQEEVWQESLRAVFLGVLIIASALA
jgi:hypothetical protein